MSRLVVVGAGHAGVEAAHAAARLGVDTLLVTMNLDQIGQMSCNPSIGGVGKGHMVRELDALGGLMGRLADAACIHFRTLNGSRGMAVRGPRAQADRVRYRAAARQHLETLPNLRLLQGVVAGLLWGDGHKVVGVELLDGTRIPCDAVVLTAGTFLRGSILVGDRRIAAGRAGEPPADALADQMRGLGLRTRRLKTGTSPRISRASIDFSRLEEQAGDPTPRGFSFYGPRPRLRQVSCHITHTTEATERAVRDNLARSSMYGGHVEGVGPRYCPSIEDKFVKFPHKGSHQIFVEPDSLETDEIYLAGLSTSMPVDVQLDMVRSLPGFEAAEIVRSGYAIEYDSYDPLQLTRTLALQDFEGLWLAGQINGTTGYEEAAGQGFLAGVNAARWIRGEAPVVIPRDQAYLGVMVDDLVTKGTDEPYRMLTARAEHRLELACDLADVRLLPFSKDIGIHSDREWRRTDAREVVRSALRARCREAWVAPSNPFGAIAAEVGLNLTAGMTLMDLLRRQQMDHSHVDQALGLLEGVAEDDPEGDWDPEFERDLLLFEARFAPIREREAKLLEGQRAWDHVRIPSDFRIQHLPGLSNEVKEKLLHHRPETLGQAARIPGITPAAVTLLHLLIDRRT